MSTAVLQIFAPLSPAFRRQTFREAKVDGVEGNGWSRTLRAAELDAEVIVMNIPTHEVGLLDGDEGFYRC